MRRILSILLVTAISPVAFAQSGSAELAELQRRLEQVERDYELDPALQLVDDAEAFALRYPSTLAYMLVARACLYSAELRRFEYEENKDSWSLPERREFGNVIDNIADRGHLALEEIPDELSEKYRIEADLFATMIRTKARGSRYKNRMEKAKDKALELDPNNPHALVTAAKRPLFAEERHGGDVEFALGLLNKAIEIDPNLERAIVFRGMAYDKLGFPEKATAEWDRALELNPKSQLAKKNLNAIFKTDYDDDE